MSDRKFRVGQVVIMTSVRKEMPFRIVDSYCDGGQWFYAFNKNNFVSESSIREVRIDEISSNPPSAGA